jgi:hypothetical protein
MEEQVMGDASERSRPATIAAGAALELSSAGEAEGVLTYSFPRSGDMPALRMSGWLRMSYTLIAMV